MARAVGSTNDNIWLSDPDQFERTTDVGPCPVRPGSKYRRRRLGEPERTTVGFDWKAAGLTSAPVHPGPTKELR